MGVLDDVVSALLPGGVSRQSAFATQGVKVGAASGEDLVHVRLVTGVPYDRIVGRVEDPVKGDRQFHDPEIGTKVPTGSGNLLHQECPNLLRQLRHLRRLERPDIMGASDPLEESVGGVHRPGSLGPKP